MSADTSCAPTLVRIPITPELPNGDPVDWNQLDVRVDGPSQITDLEVTNTGGKVFVAFKASVIGTYKCIITYQEQNVRQTPITINVTRSPGQQAPEQPQQPQQTSQSSSSSPMIPPFRTIRFRVPSKHQASGLGVYVSDGPDLNPPRSAVLQEGDQLAVCLDVSKPGFYRVGVKGPSGDIEGSPFKINVPPIAFSPR